MLTSAGSITLGYDPLLRLYQTAASGATTRFEYDPGSGSGAGGQSLIAEYDGSNALQRRFVHGPGVDEPLVWYEGSGTSTRRYFHADERGSVIAVSDDSGNLYATVNRYDEYGVPQGTLTGRFGYTGQAWLPEVGLSYSRARMYNPNLPRFMQTDPIGYGDGMNIYAYVGNDPVNATDPSGLGNGKPPVKCINQCSGTAPTGTLIRGGGGANTLGVILGPSASAWTRWTLVDRNTGTFHGYKYVPLSMSGPYSPGRAYWGDTFGFQSTYGESSRDYPSGRINSSRNGPYETALREADQVADLNGISELGAILGVLALGGIGIETIFGLTIPLPLGNGWFMTPNEQTNWTNFTHTSGLAFRTHPTQGIRLDIPTGFRLPTGRVYTGPGKESVHYDP